MDSQPDEDQGDISLLLAAARTPTRRTSPPQPIPAIDLDVAVPQRNRLFLEPQRARGVSTDRPISSSANTHSRNDSPGNDLSDDGATTPESTTRKFWDGKASDIGPRPSSAQPPVSENPSQSAIAPHPTQPPAKRTPSSLGRSRSLNVRMPSAMPSADTSYHQLGASSTPLSATEVCPTPSDKIGWARRPGEPRPPPLVGEDVARKMGRWIKEIVVCNFDLERGPVVERRAGGRRWGLGEKENVAFSSFPDTSLFSEGTILFSFKIRHISPDPATLAKPEPLSPLPKEKGMEERLMGMAVQDTECSPIDAVPGNGTVPALMSTGQKAEEYRKWDERGREWLYGFVWFEQRRDKRITRGYMQKSLVILTHLPFPALFSAVQQKIAPNFFEYGYSAIEAACHSIASWPDPTPDTVLHLPLLSDIITVKLPDTTENPQILKVTPTSTLSVPILASLPTSSPLRAFAPFIASLWSLWECLILAEPILIIAPDPRTCSEIVWWLRDFLRPIPPTGDFRPYLHIHDHDLSLLINANKPQPGVVVGVTNPFFRNAASHWPNVISIPSQRGKRKPTGGAGSGTGTIGGGIGGWEEPEGFISRRTRSVQKDRVLLKRLEGLIAEGKLDDPAGNEALRRHFQQITERFLVPLNRYFQTLVPTRTPQPSSRSSSPFPISSTTPSINTPNPAPTHLSPFPQFSHPSPTFSLHAATSTAGIRPFSLPTFLSHLRTSGPNPLLFKARGLTSKSRVENDFYASFCMSPGFAGWLAGRVDSLGAVLGGGANSMTGNQMLMRRGSNIVQKTPPGGKSPHSQTRSVSTTVPTSSPDAHLNALGGGGGLTPRPPFGRSASVGLGITGPVIYGEPDTTREEDEEKV
ncbi:hypothetical protein C356_04888 [Cryptococcus neoformans c45]|nr:hypothetical protein C356_04888 [Cryptococcus neoformans var. grubii c45]